MPTYHIHITGCVQGVGFRPFVYRLAVESDLKGWVNNGANGVHIEVNGPAETVQHFYERCLIESPREANLTAHHIETIQPKTFDSFRIITSETGGSLDMAITPDFAMCERCREELQEPLNRRYGYPFITCTNCGPRYSISTAVPYDRENTTMGAFDMCASCQKEYDKPLNHRYYSQTNSCSTCGINLQLHSHNGAVVLDTEDMIKEVHQELKAGNTIAVKGIGGYLLLCSATNHQAIARLRSRKERPDKPFAVLYPDLESAQCDVHITDTQAKELSGAAAPIVIAPLKETPKSGICSEDVAPRLKHLGVMLPYAPLLWLVAHRFGMPLVATSANLSGSPIVYKDDQALAELFIFADLVLTHNRDIVIPQDDSVVRYLPNSSEHVLVRRSRGLAPNYFHNLDFSGNQTMLALGAEMKGGYTLNVGENLYTSQYLGNLSGYDAQLSYRKSLFHFIKLTCARPDVIITDSHPDYFTTSLGQELASQWNIPVYQVQHHKAHFASVLAENELIASEHKVLGVIWDGTGFGDDGKIWGGEFFDYDQSKITRTRHFEYFPIISGDQMARWPKLSAFSLSEGDSILKENFSDVEWEYFAKAGQKSGYFTSSVGRIFDAVCSILGLLQESTYEGQAALLLEECALDFFKKNTWRPIQGYEFQCSNEAVSVRGAVRVMIHQVRSGAPRNEVAARFHQTLVDIIDAIGKGGGYERIALSGGVFQNALLVWLIKSQLSEKYDLFFHKQLSPNDENISLGQFMHYNIEKNLNQDTMKTQAICV